LLTTKVKTGVIGLDEILFGGVLENESVLIEGLPGTGKTTLGMHFILQGIAEGQNGIIITFEEFPAQYYRDALNFGWDLRQLEKDKKLKIIITSAKVLSQELERPGGMIERLIQEMDVKRILIDSINFLYKIKDEKQDPRNLINRFINAFKRQKITSFLVKDIEARDDNTHLSMYSVDCYIRLIFDLVSHYQRRRLIEVFKARGQKHLHGQHPFEITNDGVEVYPTILPNVKSELNQSSHTPQRIKTGVPGLDNMLGGGLLKNQTFLVAGTSGTGKTNLAIHFLAEGLKADESCLYISLGEQGNNLFRYAQAFNLDLKTAFEKERLNILNISDINISEGEFLNILRQNLNIFRPQRLVIDPISFLNDIATSSNMIKIIFQSMTKLFRESQVTTFLTSETSEVVGASKLSDYNLSYLVDTVILLRLAEIESAIHKAIMIIKHRESSHDRNLRELLITPEGIKIGEPFLNHEGILSGVPHKAHSESNKILIVDDDPQMVELIKASFRNERFSLLTCNDGESALQTTMLEGPDIILLDLMLPKLNGFEVCQKLKADPALSDIPVIILSAKGTTETKVEGIEIGADDYITKPFSPQELVARVKMILRRVYSKGKK